ncbi:MAG: hypothetical protein CMM24_10135 [Rhodospirillaceae bacterium]|nr:hypothetical protein [Rhodospirillaceae bacterium]
MRYAITKCFLCILLIAMPVIAKADLGKETGLHVPRFVSMNSSKVNVRAGPGTRYPIKWVFQRKTLPVQIVAESDTWRKIRDFEGIEGWVHQRMLSGRRRAVVIGGIQQLKREPQETAKTVALLEPGVILRLEKCSGAWCLVEGGSYEGWIDRQSIWGVDAND